MENLFHTTDQSQAPETLNLIVEIPKGSSQKFEYNLEQGSLELDRALPDSLVYPISYCAIPGAWNDGDDNPLDALFLSSTIPVAGSIVKGRVIGFMEMIDTGEVDHKILCVSEPDTDYQDIHHIKDLTEKEKKDIRDFFEKYKETQEKSGSVKVHRFLPHEDAYEIIRTAQKAYTKKFAK